MIKRFEIINPADQSVFAERTYHQPAEIEQSLQKAQEAFYAWSKVPLEKRQEIGRKALQWFNENANVLGEEVTRMMGRPIRYSPMEITRGFMERGEYMISAAEEALSPLAVTEKAGFRRYIKKEPLGTVLVLAPWNYPYLTAVNAVIPAIMAGNTVILKHAEQTALCSERFLEAFQSAGLPSGVFQYLHLTHEQVAEVIADERISYVAFTGSVAGGSAIQAAVGKRLITAGLELGGKDPAFVDRDADLGNAIENLVDGAFFNSGQSCCGIERIYVNQEIFDDFVDGFVALTRQYVMGDPMLRDTTLGPMVRKSNAQKALDQVNEAISMGALPMINTSDFPSMEIPYLAPQVLTGVTHEMRLMQEESFAPVVGIMAVENEEEAIRLMNDSPYGLTASIWTKDPEKAIRIGDQVRTGTWFMNRCDYLDPELAWTGIKNSGKGCTLSVMGYEHLTRPKSYHLKLI